MQSKRMAVLACAILISAVGFTVSKIRLAKKAELPDKICTLTFDTTTIYKVPQARTVPQMQRGLSNLLDVGNGMLFTWPDEAVRAFWMKDTQTPLSIAFIKASGEVTQIEDMEPNSEKIILSNHAVSDALEVKRGEFKRLGIRLGSKLIKSVCK